MTHHEISRFLAAIVLICGVILLVVDVAEGFGSKIALRIKWSSGWSITRYVGIVCSVVLALDVFF